MEIYIKVAPQDYERLRSVIPAESPARQALDNATRVDHAIEGVLFEGYNIPCDEAQASAIRAAARQCCPDVVRAVDQAVLKRFILEGQR